MVIPSGDELEASTNRSFSKGFVLAVVWGDGFLFCSSYA